MTAKAYLGQARFLDMRIKSKIQQIESLNELATSCTAALSDMPRNPNKGRSRVEDCVMKILELQALLEKRYLCFLSWEKIAVDMHYSIQHIYRMHDTALAAVEEILPHSVT